MPASRDEPAIGLQLWLNLPRHLKMTEPIYQSNWSTSCQRWQRVVEAIVIADEVMTELQQTIQDYQVFSRSFLPS